MTAEMVVKAQNLVKICEAMVGVSFLGGLSLICAAFCLGTVVVILATAWYHTGKALRGS